MSDTAYLPVSLKHLQFLQALLDAASAREADPDAEVFKLLDAVRKTRGEAVKSKIFQEVQAATGRDDLIDAHTTESVFVQVIRCLAGHDLALETLNTYKEDSERGLMTVQRLRGFLQGLSACSASPCTCLK
jgi:hypothetical protein